MTATSTDTRASLEQLVSDTEERIAQAEAIVSKLPQLRTELRALRRTLKAIDEASTPRQASRGGPTIRERILSYIEAEGGRVDFEPGTMLRTVHAEVGGNKNSVQVEIHRLEKSIGLIEVVRDEADKPVALVLKREPLRVVEGERVEA